MMRWSRPELLVLLAALPWFWWSATRAARRPTVRAALVRTFIALLLVLAAAGTHVAMRDGRLTVMYALDRSDSIGLREQAAALATMNAWSDTMRRGDTAGALVFGASPVLERAPVQRLRVPEITSSIQGSGTNIAAALAAARNALGEDGSRRIVLLSDGRQTSGDASRETSVLASLGIAVDVLPIGAEADRARLVATRVEVAAEVRAGERFLVTVEFAGRPGGKGVLSLTRDGQPFASREVVAPAGGVGSAAFTDAHTQGGIHAYQAAVVDELDDDQSGGATDTAPGAMVSVLSPASLLYVAASARTAGLPATGFRVTSVQPHEVPSTAAALRQFDAVVLDDVPSEELQATQLSALKEYVERDGGGLLLLGSPRNLDAGSYPAGLLEPLLPVDFRPRSGRRSPSMAFVLVFDKSGSMADLAGGVPKIELARQSVMKVLDVVPGSDPLGVIAFDASPATITPLSSSRDARAIEARLRELKPGGSTAMAPALELAMGWLRDAGNVARRHVLLLSDGRSTPADAQRVREAVRGRAVEVSVVAIGADADRPMLENLARSTGGRAFFPRDLRELPHIIAREAARAAGGATVVERFTLRLMPHPLLAGLDVPGLPELGGYVVSAAKPGAETVLASHLGDPILAISRAGLGKVALYTADLHSPWSAGLRRWNAAPELWRHALQWLSRGTGAQGLLANVVESPDGNHLVVDAWNADASFASDLSVHAAIRGPNGDGEAVTLRPTAPGRYEGDIRSAAAGAYTMAVTARDPEGNERRLLRGFYWSADRERRAAGTDTHLLGAIAAATSGRVLGPGDSPFAVSRRRDFSDVSSWLAAAALLLFFAEVILVGLLRTRPGIWWAERRQRIARGAKAA